ncbi:MAG: hypothetical protein GY772_14190 [bacterium]|nr:hypothetical protein [bacterium]
MFETVEEADCDGTTAIHDQLSWRCQLDELSRPRTRVAALFVEEGCAASAGTKEQAVASCLRIKRRNIISANDWSGRAVGGRYAARGGPAVVHRRALATRRRPGVR